MPRLYLVRHGESYGNAAQVYQGHQDYLLTPAGHSQARLIAQRLASVSLEAVYTSDLRRARDTATCVAQAHSLEPIVEPLWREITFGQWEGRTQQEIQATDVHFWEAFHSDPTLVAAPGGENFAQVTERVKIALERLIQRQHQGPVALVIHGGTIRALVCHLLEIPLRHLWHLRLDLASLSIFNMDSSRAILELWNDTSHLSSMQHEAIT